MKKLSLIIPVFNSAGFLEKTLNSLLDDLGPKLEIILIDDGSTDASFEICQNFCQNDSQIQLIRFETNQGVGIVRNTGLDKANGEFVAFLDSDDCLEVGALQSLLRFIESVPDADAIVCRCQVQYSELPSKNVNNFDNDILNKGSVDQRVEHIWKTQISEGYFGRCFYFVVRKQLILDSGIKFANTPIYEDQEYVCRLLCNVNNIAYFNYPYYRHMIRGSSLSMCHNLKMSIACVKASASLFRLSKEYLHSPLRQNFIESRALVILSLLGHQILLLSDDEVKTIAETFESEGKPFEYVSLSDQGFPMITAMQAQGCVEGLVAYTKEMKEEILDFISEVDSLYIFGVNTLTRGVVRLCQRQGIHIEAILDNNVKSIPTQGLGCKIAHPSILEKISSRELAKIKVFIATLNKSSIRKISNQLRSFSIQENQISTLPQAKTGGNPTMTKTYH